MNLEDDKPISYQHIAFECDDLNELMIYLDSVDIVFEQGRKRHKDEKPSIYIRDPFQNLIEFHTGTLKDRLAYYKQREDIEVR